MSPTRDFHIVLWGATSFVGKIIAEYLLQRLGVNGDIRWALGARNLEKLHELQGSLGGAATELPLLVGDSFDRDFLDDLASRTQVVLTTVGPYAKYGEPILAACATHGTDYCDLTGEPNFVRSMQDRYLTQAQRSGARIVNCAGFDSLPSDLGVFYLNDFARRELDSSLRRVEMQVRSAKGGLSGGTIASALETMALVRKEPSLTKVLQNPYAICPPDRRSGVRQPGLFKPRKSELTGQWLHHFMMAPVNTKVVHATNALLDYPYGEDFLYSEWQATPNAVTAHLATVAISLSTMALYFSWTRAFLARYVLPKPGEGPDREARENGHFSLLFSGVSRNDERVSCRVTGDADPGYGSTAKQISEVALGLAARPDEEGGFFTPASALGLSLIDPLTAHAGLTFEAWAG